MQEVCSFAGLDDQAGSRGAIWKRLQIGTCVLGVLGCSSGAEPVRPPGALEVEAPIVLETLHFSGYRGAAPDLEVRARKASMKPDQQVAELRDVDIQFRDSERGPLHVRSDRADLDLETQAFVLHENVHGEVGDGERFTTSEVRYDHELHRLYTEQPVDIEHGRIAFQGKGMVIDVASGRLTLNELTGATK